MATRIYDIAQKFGLESKQVLDKAKELGITAARVASSSLDDITAEYLEGFLTPKKLPARTVPVLSIGPTGSNNSEQIKKLQLPSDYSTPPQKSAVGGRALGSSSIRLTGNTEVHIYGVQENIAHFVASYAFQIGKDDPEESRRNAEPILLLANTESSLLEFKPAARWDPFQCRENGGLQKGVQKTVAAFLNSEGGTLLIGVADNGQVLGLEDELRTLQNPLLDDYLLFLTSIIFGVLGQDLTPCIQISFPKVKDKQICCINVKHSPRPVYLKEGENELLYTRVGNSSRPMVLSAAIEYIRTRWP